MRIIYVTIVSILIITFIGFHNRTQAQISVDLQVFLEGPYNGSEMITNLNSNGYIPLSNPYNIEPWNYDGAESVTSIPNIEVVDWILVELRKAKGDSAYVSRENQIDRKAAFLLSDGSVVGLDGQSLLSFNLDDSDRYHPVIWHRNHIAIISVNPMLEEDGTYSYDFTSDSEIIYGGQLSVKNLNGGNLGMIGGDGNADNQTDNQDKDEIWLIQNGNTGYLSGDYNLDGTVDQLDLTDIWMDNSGNGTQLKPEFVCGEKFVDKRDGRIYQTVKIGRQCWMKQNLNHGTIISGSINQVDNGVIEKYCYDDLETNCDTYGGLYQWDEIVQYDTSAINQGVCPKGWHLPLLEEWEQLVEEAGGSSLAGDSLVFGGSSGFEALMSGIMDSPGNFTNMGSRTNIWSSQYEGASNAHYIGLQINNSNIDIGSKPKSEAYAVRCVQGNPIETNSNVIVIDTNSYILQSDSLELVQGLYRFEYTGKGKFLNFSIGDIITGIAENGYLRSVISFTENPPYIELLTLQATFEDLFESGDLKFNFCLDNLQGKGVSQSDLEITYLAKGVELKQSGCEFEYLLDDVSLFENGGLSLNMTNGSIKYNPNFNFDYEFKDGSLKRFLFNTDQSVLENHFDVVIEAQGGGSVSAEKKLASFKKSFIKMVGYVPIVVIAYVDVFARANLSVDFNTNVTTGFTNTNQLNLGVEYNSGVWSKIWEIQETNEIQQPTLSSSVNLTENLSISPEISLDLYGVAGPYLKPEFYEEFQVNLNLATSDFDASCNVGVDAKLGADVDILGKVLASFPEEDFKLFDYQIWNLADVMEKVPGCDNQTGNTEEELPTPIQVKVFDNKMQTFANILVHFEIIEGNGTLSTTEPVLTNTEGIAEVYWTLGPEEGANKLNAKVIKADGSEITNSPLEFNATAQNSINDTIQLLTNGSSKKWRFFDGFIIDQCDGEPFTGYDYWKFMVGGELLIERYSLDGVLCDWVDVGEWDYQNGRLYIVLLDGEGDAQISELSEDFLQLYFEDWDEYMSFDTTFIQ